MVLTNGGKIWRLRTNRALTSVSVTAVDRPRALTVLRMFFSLSLFHCQETSQTEDKFFLKIEFVKVKVHLHILNYLLLTVECKGGLLDPYRSL